jgi:hypothetical protein
MTGGQLSANINSTVGVKYICTEIAGKLRAMDSWTIR